MVKIDKLLGTRIPIKTIKSLKKGAKKPSAIPDKLKEKYNITALIHFSNVTPFKVKTFKGYICFFCPDVFTDPQELREHTRASHTKDRITFYNSASKYNTHINVDIEDLQCTLCSQKITDLLSLKEHLLKVHDEKVFLEYNEKATPFKLTKNNPLYCAVCTQPFGTFKLLSQHMNSHYRNYVCKLCDAGFVTLQRLKNHESSHVEGAYPCSYCNKVYKNTKKVKDHIRGTHTGTWDRYKCLHCGKKFTSYDRRRQHLVDEHNEQPRELECNACELRFTTTTRLHEHTRRFHLHERNFQCIQCEKAFFTKVMLEDHMLVHTGVRAFQCKVCHKSYGRKFTLREHMRIHDNDRRFACSECGKKFVQKCSLKRHITRHHPEYYLNLSAAL